MLGHDPVDEAGEPGSPLYACLTRIIHERFCCNRGFAIATSLSAGVLAVQSLAATLARLSTRLHDFATNRRE